MFFFDTSKNEDGNLWLSRELSEIKMFKTNRDTAEVRLHDKDLISSQPSKGRKIAE